MIINHIHAKASKNKENNCTGIFFTNSVIIHYQSTCIKKFTSFVEERIAHQKSHVQVWSSPFVEYNTERKELNKHKITMPLYITPIESQCHASTYLYWRPKQLLTFLHGYTRKPILEATHWLIYLQEICDLKEYHMLKQLMLKNDASSTTEAFYYMYNIKSIFGSQTISID